MSMYSTPSETIFFILHLFLHSLIFVLATREECMPMIHVCIVDDPIDEKIWNPQSTKHVTIPLTCQKPPPPNIQRQRQP
ncbi:hypothetical protein BDV28DRAFT_130638 [Aspergillus coremiiformis]|uniref:Uncharacterized protein n=1 Tax=Aspergillus coremiiformis TaxID=138285 RepID=A0A5N6ZBQ0_9EURO|nr:hypothetical protein BDV28DRAFT_130638 [Aspergillus coremiiformis]